MAFPTNTTLLDDFNRADEDPITTNWTTPSFTGDGSQELVSNQFGGRGADAYYDVTQFAEDQEAHVTIAVLGTSSVGIYHRVCLRTQDVGTANGTLYTFSIVDSGAGWTAQITGQKAGSALGNLSGSQAIATPVAGDKIGAQAIGSALAVWYFHGGSWSSVATATDTQITGAGYIQLAIDDSIGRYDDVRGGNVIPPGATMAWIGAAG